MQLLDYARGAIQVVVRSIEVYDSAFMTVASGSPTLTPGSSIINNSDTPDGTIFQFSGGTPSGVTLDDTSANVDVLEDDDYAHHTITDGAGLVATGTGVESESLIFVRALDEFGNQVGPTITITVFSQGNNTQDVWGFHSDTPLVAGTQYAKTGGNSTGSTSYSSVASQPVCYAPGALIETPKGPRPVETLRAGELVLSADNGAQPILWVRNRDHILDGAADDKKPVLIQAGALGSGLPTRDLIVSPQHRILVGGGQLNAHFRDEVFVAAKSLTTLPGIRHMKGKRAITWIHFACDRHEVVLANGCQSESLLLGSMVLSSLRFLERQNVIDIFGAVASPDVALNGAPARECMTVGTARRQLEKACHRRARDIRKWEEDAALEQREVEMQRAAETLGLSEKRRMV